MKTWDKLLVSLLDPILPVTAEPYNEPISVPCITYRMSNNTRVVEGDDLRYSGVYYTIKLHIKDLEEAEDYLQQIDTTLYMNRFFREGFNHIIVGDVHEFVLTYRVQTRERLFERNDT